ncbi:MAG TPA: hypothetical protein VKZ59_12900 [Acidobacteriota bacterium]|nr:hypothetical protein [Acidobacteriota bacterium]
MTSQRVAKDYQTAMTEETIRRLVLEALSETPGKAATISLIVRKDNLWMILLEECGEELAIRVNENEVDGDESAKRILAEQIRMLF